MLQILKMAASVVTILVGMYAVIWPQQALAFTGLTAPGGRGISEVRAVLGGLFVGLAAAVLYANTKEAYWILGVTYLAIGLVRLVSIVMDKAVASSNIYSLAFEIVFGILLIL